MPETAQRPIIPFSTLEQIRAGRDVIEQEAAALKTLAAGLDASFCAALDLCLNCRGCVVVTGLGKAGLIGKKITATLSSTGTRSQFLHPTEAVHGDLGSLHQDDVLLALSNSGETEEICALIPIMKQMQIPIIAITATRSSTLGSNASVTLQLGRLPEAGMHGLAPSTSTTAMLALGDALALATSRVKGFTPQQFARFHPGGSLGLKLKLVCEVMRKPEELRIARADDTIREILVRFGQPGRRSGVILLIDNDGKLAGLFTDSDLARLLEQHKEQQLDRPIRESMTQQPRTLPTSALISEAVDILSQHKLSEIPIVNEENKPMGLIDITDVVGLFPSSELAQSA